MGMRPMTPARLATGLFGLGRRLVLLAKRGGLTFGFPAKLLDQQQQFLDLSLEPAIFSGQFFVRRTDLGSRPVIVSSISRRAHTGYTTRIQLAGQRQHAGV